MLTAFQGVNTNKNVQIVALRLYKCASIVKTYHYTKISGVISTLLLKAKEDNENESFYK